MCEEKCCCNCSHCARWRTKNGIECHCDLTDKYLGYLDVMDEDNHCKNWEKETKFDLQDAHDAQTRTDAIEDFYDMLKNPITLDALANAKDKHMVLAILKRQLAQIKCGAEGG